MPITDLYPQVPAAFRIRLGATEDAISKAGRHYRRPVHLGGVLRVTSPVRAVVEDIAAAYEGDAVAVWERQDGPSEWETRLRPRPIRVTLLPGSSLSQWWEHWSGGSCDRRCDGSHDIVGNRPCSCPPVDERTDREHDCQPVSRVTLLLPRMTMLCAGRLDTGSRIAASSLMGTIQAAAVLLDQGVLVAGTLYVRTREQGARHYSWPEITLDGPGQLPSLAKSASSGSAAPLPGATSALPAGEGEPSLEDS